MNTERPNHAWVPYAAALAGAALLLKATLIIASGGQVDETPMATLYLVGIGVALAAAVGAGLRRRRLPARIAVAGALAALLVLWIIGLSDAAEPLFALVSDTAHVRDEAPVGAAGLVLLLAAWRGFSRDHQAMDARRLALRNA